MMPHGVTKSKTAIFRIKVKDIRSKTVVLFEYKCQIWSIYRIWFEVYGQKCKVFFLGGGGQKLDAPNSIP